jgi:hypothetical protein
VTSDPLLVQGGKVNTGQTPHLIFRRILFYGVGIRGLLARTSFRPVKSEYRTFYSRFTGHKNRESVRHALIEAAKTQNLQTEECSDSSEEEETKRSSRSNWHVGENLKQAG